MDGILIYRPLITVNLHRSACIWVFRIRLYGNPKCLLYCPVHWLLKHWSDRDKLEAPILEKITEDTFQSQLKFF
jgi:hypothetical protein